MSYLLTVLTRQISTTYPCASSVELLLAKNLFISALRSFNMRIKTCVFEEITEIQILSVHRLGENMTQKWI